MRNWLIENNFMEKIIKAEKKGGGGIKSKVIDEYTPLLTKYQSGAALAQY